MARSFISTTAVTKGGTRQPPPPETEGSPVRYVVSFLEDHSGIVWALDPIEHSATRGEAVARNRQWDGPAISIYDESGGSRVTDRPSNVR